MKQHRVEAFVDKLALLEQKTGAMVHYAIMDPLPDFIPGCLAMQAAAKQIAEFVGLHGFTFIVATTKQKDKVGGHIDLSTSGQEVFIEIDSEILEFPAVAATVLGHEICHKWLQAHGIRSSYAMDHEMLTDISCVFLGLGKIMLNGCRGCKMLSVN